MTRANGPVVCSVARSLLRDPRPARLRRANGSGSRKVDMTKMSTRAQPKVTTFGPITRIAMTATLAGRPVHHVSAYALGDTLIDSGAPRAAPALLDWARTRNIRRIVHTHHHEDHTGGDALLVDALGVRVEAPPRTIPILQHFYRLPLYRRLVWGQPRNVTAHPLGARVEIGGYPFRVIPTPGHSADHVALFQPDERWLFTGDLYIAPRVLYLRPVEDACEEMASLRRLIRLQPRLLICSHSGFIQHPTAALEARLTHWETLAANARKLARAGISLRQIRRRLTGAEGLMCLLSAGNFSKINLVRSLLGCQPGG